MPKQKSIGGDVPTNGGKTAIENQFPYQVSVKIQGIADLLFHRWNCEAVDARAASKRGSAERKTDDIETYVYRNDAGDICLPGEYLRMAIINAAKYKSDPRSVRKSCMDLYKACVVSLTGLASLGKDDWDYEDKRKVNIQRNGINRTRPAFKAGWEATFDFLINIPEYVNPMTFNEVLQMAGRLVGVGDFRPTYGRFNVVEFKVT